MNAIRARDVADALRRELVAPTHRVENRPARPSPDAVAPDLADLYADNDTTYINGNWCKHAHDGHCSHSLVVAGGQTCIGVGAQTAGLVGRESSWLDRAVDTTRTGGSLGDGPRPAGGRMGLGDKLLALVVRLNAERRRAMPDAVAVVVYGVTVTLLLLWAMGII